MGRNLNRVLAIVAFVMVAAVVAALGYQFYQRSAGSTDSTGGIATSKVSYDAVGKYGEGLAPVKIYKLWGYSDKNGKVLIVPQFAEAGSFSEGRAAVKAAKDELYGYIDNSGQYVLEPQFAYAGLYSSGLASCRENKNDKLGYIDQNGDIKIPAQYAEAGDFSEGLARVRLSDNGGYGFINPSGVLAIPAQFEKASDFSQGLAAVQVKGSWGYIDKTGKMVLPTQYADAHAFFGDVAAVKQSGVWGYIDKLGKPVIKNSYEEAGDFSGSYAPIKQNGLWGYMDKKETKSVEPKYVQAMNFSSGVAAGLENGKWVFLSDEAYRAAETGKVSEEAQNGTITEKPETIDNKNITGLIKAIRVHENESVPLTGTIKTNSVIEKLVLSVLGEDGKARGIYLSIKPNKNGYNLDEVSIDSRIEPFNVLGKYKLQLWAKLKGATDEAKIGEVAVEVVAAQSTAALSVELIKIDSAAYPAVNAYASVFDKSNNAVMNLTKASFKLYELMEGQNELEQTITAIKAISANEGISLALCLDSSLSMYNKDKSEKGSNMAAAKDAAIRFVNSNQFTSKDKLAILSFGKKFTVNQGFTLDKAKLAKAVKQIKSQPDTAIYDAVAKSVELLAKQSGRKCLIIFSDGADTSSKVTYAAATQKALAAGIPIYSIALGQEGKTNEFKSISDKSGGAFYYLKDPKMLNQIYKSITDKQKNQYQLVYQAKVGTVGSKSRRIRVEVTVENDKAQMEKSYQLK